MDPATHRCSKAVRRTWKEQSAISEWEPMCCHGNRSIW